MDLLNSKSEFKVTITYTRHTGNLKQSREVIPYLRKVVVLELILKTELSANPIQFISALGLCLVKPHVLQQMGCQKA